MKKGTAADRLKAIEAKMEALRSELLRYSEERQAQDASLPHSDSAHLPLMHSILTIQEAMKTFLSLATSLNK